MLLFFLGTPAMVIGMGAHAGGIQGGANVRPPTGPNWRLQDGGFRLCRSWCTCKTWMVGSWAIAQTKYDGRHDDISNKESEMVSEQLPSLGQWHIAQPLS